MSQVFDIADGFVDALVDHDPIAATFIGVAGHDHLMSDFSPDSAEEMAQIERRTLADIRAASPQSERERLCRDTVIDEIECGLALYDEGEHFRALNILHSPVQSIRMVFDMMPQATADDWSNIARRMEKVPEAVETYRRTLETGVSRGLTASRRQTAGCAEQAQTWSGAVRREFLLRRSGGPVRRVRPRQRDVEVRPGARLTVGEPSLRRPGQIPERRLHEIGGRQGRGRTKPVRPPCPFLQRRRFGLGGNIQLGMGTVGVGTVGDEKGRRRH